MKVEVVEAANLVRAVVCAVSSSDAAVVDHRIDALGIMDRGGNGANLLARCVLAVNTSRRYVDHIGVRNVPLEVSIDPNPMHFAIG